MSNHQNASSLPSPTLSRASNTSRRLSVWVQQTWRERTIPVADFSSSTSKNATAANISSPTKFAPSRSSVVSSPTSGIIVTTPVSQRFSTPPPLTRSPSCSYAALASPSATNRSPSATNDTIDHHHSAATVSNVDEAFGAWTSLYKFQNHFPLLEKESKNDNNNNDSSNYDWILDGCSEWEAQDQRYRDLLQQLYPSGNSKGLLDTMEGNTGNNDDDDETLLLLKFGSAMGQQEYQFASFETADFSNSVPALQIDATNQEKANGDSKATNDNEDDFQFDADFSNMENPKVEKRAAEDEQSLKDRKEMSDPKESVESPHSFSVGDANSDDGNQIQKEASDKEIQDTDENSQKSNNDDACQSDKLNNAEQEMKENDGENENHDSKRSGTEVEENLEQNNNPSEITSTASGVENEILQTKNIDFNATTANDNATDADGTVVTSDDNFEEFWQKAIEAETPETGTYPSFASRSTYVTSPLASSVEASILTPLSSTFFAKNGETLECIQSQDDNDVKNDDDESDFGEFQDVDKLNGDENDCVAHPPSKSSIDQSFDEGSQDPLDDVNASFETAHTPAQPITTNIAHDSLSSPRTRHAGATPLKKNGGCQTPHTPLQASPSFAYSDRGDGVKTPQTHHLRTSPQHAGKTPVEIPLTVEAAQAAAAAAATMEQFTPVTRNFPFQENDKVPFQGAESKSFPFGARTTMVLPVNNNMKGTPDRQCRLKDINQVMNGIPDEEFSNFEEDELDGGIVNSIIDDGKEEDQGEESLLDESIQSNSIPSVVQLFTKSVDPERRPKIVIPQTVRASSQRASLNSSTNLGLSMPAFYFGQHQNNFSKRRSSSEIVSLSASEVASASESILSMPMMKGMHRRRSSSKIDSERFDEPSINSNSIASPEVKFIRRHKNAHSKSSIRNHRISSSSINSRTSRTTEEGDDRSYFYHYYYGDDPHDSDGELTDEESQSLGSLSTLPQEYWKHPESDHTLRELSKLEWDWLPYWQMDSLLDDFDADLTTDNIPLLQEQITQKLSLLDAFYGKICKKVYRRIQPHSEALQSANHAALDLQQNLQLSKMYLSRSQQSIQLAKYGSIPSEQIEGNKGEGEEGVGVHGALRLLELWDIQHSYHDLSRIEGVISEICDLEDAISQRIRCFDTYKQNSMNDCDTIIDMVADLEAKLNVDPANRLVCFDATRQRVQSFISHDLVSRLHECISDLAVEWSRASESTASTLYVADGAAYSRLIVIILLIAKSHPRSSSPRREICTSIQTSLMLEIQKSFGRALLDPTDSELEGKSDYEQELAALGSNEAYLDANRLPIWTHNLVTIRFEFEMRQGGKRPLPAIFHKLCLLLTNVLCGMHRLIEWHDGAGDDNGDAVDSGSLSATAKNEIGEELKSRRASIWNACIQSIEECMEEYRKHSGKKKLFSKKDGEYDDSSWREDLDGIHEVSILAHQFLSIGPLFLEGVPKEVINDGSSIEESLDSFFKAHLRTFQVEAMNTLGTMFYREDWKVHSLLELQGKKVTPTIKDDDTSVRLIVESISNQLKYRATVQQTACCRSKCNMFAREEHGNQSDKSLLMASKNPFEIDQDPIRTEIITTNSEPFTWEDICSDEGIKPIFELLSIYLGESADQANTAKVFLKSVFDGVFPWISRLIVIMEKLPALKEEGSKVMRGMIDLYVATAFRLCSSNKKLERVLIGADSIRAATLNEQKGSNMNGQRTTSPPIFDFGFSSKSSQVHSNKPAPVISPTAEAELCALVLGESSGLKHLREFLLASQKRLEGIAKLDLVGGWIHDPVITEDTTAEDLAEDTARVLEQRQAASCNHIFVALGLFLVIRGLPSSSRYNMIRDYTDQYLKNVPLMITLSNRISCMRSIRGREILGEIIAVSSGWEESKLHENANDYVEDLCDFLALLWGALSTAERRFPSGILKTLWENLLGGGYMVLLDGFSKVPYCSTEGRSLMSMDVASYRSLTSPRAIAERLEEDDSSPNIRPIPMDIQPYRNMAYVDTYIKMFYFPSKDALEWIKTNYEQYHRHHMISLISNDRDAKNLANEIDTCYRVKERAETVRI